MNTLKDFVNFKLTHADKVAEAEGYPLKLENCKKYKKMKQLEIYGNSFQDGTSSPENPIDMHSVGELVTDESDVNYGKYKIPIAQRGKNIAYRNGIYTRENLTVTCAGSLFTINGSSTTNVTMPFSTAQTIKLKANTTYVFSINYISGDFISGVNGLVIGLKTGDDSWFNSVVCTTYPHNYRNRWATKFTSGTDTAVCVHIVGWGECNNLQIGVQIEEGAYGTAYEPYVEPVTTNIYLDEPLRKLGEYADYIDFKGNKVVRKCVKKYLKDYRWTDNSTTQYDTHACFAFRDDSILPKSGQDGAEISKGYSDYFSLIDSYNAYGTIPNGIHMHGWALNIRVTLSKEYIPNGTVDEFMSWLNENNPYMVRIRAEEMDEPLNIELPKLNAKTTIIEVDTSLAPSNIYGKYIK